MGFVFDIRKSIAAAGFLCQRSGGTIDLLKLVKMIYLADRNALIAWSRPITGDRFVSMDCGPVVSRIYNLIKYEVSGNEMQQWAQAFNPRLGNMVSLKGSVDLDPLSQREIEVLDAAFASLKDDPGWKVIDKVHQFPEWQDPHGSSIPIDPRAILIHSGFSDDRISEIESELTAVQSAKLALQSR